MSADNIIYVEQVGEKWFVWEQSASCDPDRNRGFRCVTRDTRHEAMDAAAGLELELGIVEYGIQVLDGMHELDDDDVALADAIAERAHRGQVRKWTDEHYISHPRAVADNVAGVERKIVALLHDTVEDTPMTLEVIGLLFGERIAAAVDALTKREDEPYFAFVKRAAANEIAFTVKLIDIAHNLSTLPEGHGLHKRYEKAMVLLVAEMQKEGE